jgi:PAS domain S-box-containing protein
MKEQLSPVYNLSQILGQALIENVPDLAIIAVDFEGRILSWNPGVKNLLGYDESEFVGQNFSLIFTGEDIQNSELQKETATSSDRRQEQGWYRHKDGTQICFNATTIQLKDNPAHEFAFAKILRVCTSPEQTETEQINLLKREQETRLNLENAVKANHEFLRLLSHELRNPLHTILGWTKMLRKNNFDSEQVAKALEVIERNGKAQSRLLDELFDLSRIASGKLQLKLDETNLTEIVQEAVYSIIPAAAGKNIEIETKFEPEPVFMFGDAQRIQQIISNLLINAVKFTSKGGHISVELDRIDSTAQIKIKDNGQGISPEELPLIFEPYYQTSDRLNKKESGLGLGLSLVKHLVEMHKGKVTVESAGINMGATFVVTFPTKN